MRDSTNEQTPGAIKRPRRCATQRKHAQNLILELQISRSIWGSYAAQDQKEMRTIKPENRSSRLRCLGDSSGDETDSSVIRSKNVACHPAAF